MATAEKRVVTDATGQAMLAELRKIPGVMNPVPIEKGGTGVTTPQEILEVIGAQPKFDFDVEEQLNAAVKSVNEIKPDAHGNVQILRVPMADNFASDESQVVSGAFIERTTGGDASISTGSATLGVLYGNSIRSGFTAESKNMEVRLAGRIDESIPLSATIDWDTYKNAVNYISTNKTFTFTTSWNENPETYGITLSGTPVSGDVINAFYVAENRGTITNATPTSFVETNWNLYDFEKGYARVLKYSNEYGFKIGGTYTGVSFSTSVDGEKIVITPDSDGIFTIPSDGYVFVTGGNNTDTYILMAWSDWHDGYVGDYLTYAEDTIDFSELMENVFPFGMCSIGITMDEINFNDKTAIVRVERVAYTIENRILAEQSGREFVYDDDWIYSVKETPERVRFNIDNQVSVYDHGIEYFTDTEVPVLTYELFGQNLKDKLRREVVAVTQQNFSASQKAQARENIEAAWNSEVVKSINNKVPDANGNITIVEGQSNASYGSYRIDPVIPPAAWSLVNGQYQVAYSDPLIKSTMTGAETWLDDNDAMTGATHFNAIDGALIIVTETLPTETWRLHILLAENGATVLEEVNNKAEESTIAIVETGDTAFHAINAGQYVMWNGAIYKATANIASGDTLATTGNDANLIAVTGGLGNELKSVIDANSTGITNLDGKVKINSLVSTDFDTYTGNTDYVEYYKGNNISSCTHVPSNLSGSAYPFVLEVVKFQFYSKQVLHVYNGSLNEQYTYIRQQTYSNGSIVWGNWNSYALTQAITNISVNTQHMTDATIISDLDNIPVGTQGRVKLASALRPNDNASLYDYNCHGEGTTRTLIVSSEYYKSIWVNYKNGSTWSGWNELAPTNNLRYGSAISVSSISDVQTKLTTAASNIPDNGVGFVVLNFSASVSQFPGGGRWMCMIAKQTDTYWNAYCYYGVGRNGAGYSVIVIKEDTNFYYENLALNSKFGQAIPSGTDLNNLTASGFYYAATGSIAQSLSHCPVTVNFTMIVFDKEGLRNQMITIGSNIYTRAQSTGGWGHWFNFSGTDTGA